MKIIIIRYPFCIVYTKGPRPVSLWNYKIEIVLPEGKCANGATEESLDEVQ